MATIKKIRENPKLSVILKANINIDEYINSIISSNSSEAVINEMSLYIDDINKEIKEYITKNKTALLSGMSSFSILVDKYKRMATSTQQLHTDISIIQSDIKKKQADLSIKLVEIRNIHDATTLIRYIKTYIHMKIQLDNLINMCCKPKDNDISPAEANANGKVREANNKFQYADLRQLALISKIIYDIEVMLDGVEAKRLKLSSIKIIANSSPQIIEYGKQIRTYAKSCLIKGMRSKNQSAISSCLQIFQNFNNLADVLLITIDDVIKEAMSRFEGRGSLDGQIANPTTQTANAHDDVDRPHDREAPMAHFNVSQIFYEFPELLQLNEPKSTKNQHQHVDTTFSLSGIGTVSSHNTNGVVGIVANISKCGNVQVNQHMSQLRLKLKEVFAMWRYWLIEYTNVVSTLQFVLVKKIDLATKKRFSDILLQHQWEGSLHSNHIDSDMEGHKDEKNAAITNFLLCQCKMVDLFWERLSTTLLEYFTKEHKRAPLAITRCYPSLYHAILCTMDCIADGDGVDSNGGQMPSPSVQWIDKFTLLSTPVEALGSVGQADPSINSGCISDEIGTEDVLDDDDIFGLDYYKRVTTSTAPNNTVNRVQAQVVSPNLLNCLKSIEDQYMLGVYIRITAPIYQMFPEMNGYNSAVPSKRDMLTYINAIALEYAVYILELDVPHCDPIQKLEDINLKAIANDALIPITPTNKCIYHLNKIIKKSTQLLLTKIENFISMAPNSSNNSISNSRSNDLNVNTVVFTLVNKQTKAVVKMSKDLSNKKLKASHVMNRLAFEQLEYLNKNKYEIQFNKNQHQNHNILLIKLLKQTHSSFETMMDLIRKTLNSSMSQGNAASPGVGASAAMKNMREMDKYMKCAIEIGISDVQEMLQKLAYQQLYIPIVDHIGYFIRDEVLNHLLVEYNLVSNTAGGDGEDGVCECSVTMEGLATMLPSLIAMYVDIDDDGTNTNSNGHTNGSIAPTSMNIRDIAVRELCLRIVHYFITVSAIARKHYLADASEADSTDIHARGLSSDICLKDCTALDLLITTHCPNWKLSVNSESGCKYNAVALEFM